jgi:hypothetical protein
MSFSIRSAIRGPLAQTDTGSRGSDPGARRGSRRRSLGLLASLATSAVLGATMVVPAEAALAPAAQGPVGATDLNTGFPSYYKDASGTQVKLCIDNPLCVGGALPNPGPASIATLNLPDEAFYAYADAAVTLNGGGNLKWRAVLEGTWLVGEVVDGDQMTFTRIQLTGAKINTRTYPAGTVLTAHTPYGDIAGTVTSSGTLTKNRKESAPGIVENGFGRPATEATTGYGTSFLKWDVGAPAGFIGDPNVNHTVTGAKTGQLNEIQVFRGATAVSPRVTQFSVAGQIAPAV